MPSPAPCLVKFLRDATARWPARSRISDGIMPSAEHTKQNPKSDHEKGNAADLTHDPAKGPNCNEVVSQLTASNDLRIKYIIWNRRIWFPVAGKRPKGWSAYSGSNPHTAHAHVSIKAESRNDLRPWPWANLGDPKPRPTLRRGDKGLEVRLLQGLLHIPIDGIFGEVTFEEVKQFQKIQGLTVDGIAGRQVWKALGLK